MLLNVAFVWQKVLLNVGLYLITEIVQGEFLKLPDFEREDKNLCKIIPGISLLRLLGVDLDYSRW